MAVKGVTWNEEYRKQFFANERVQENLKNFIEMARQPKSEATREKMSQAKVGRKYSETHRANMAETQRFRQALRKEIATQHPELPKDQVWSLVREEMRND